jgi:hypothetical protein
LDFWFVKPVFPPQIIQRSAIFHLAVNGRITKSLLDPESRKMKEEMYPKFAGKPLEDYDLLKRTDCLAFGKEVLAGIK